MRVGGIVFYTIASAMVLTASGSLGAAADKKPNIIIIVGDDMGYADIGVDGCRDIPTPSIDSLAAAGVRCTNGYVSAPYCSPSRAGMLTGRFQTRFGHEFNPSGAHAGLPLSETTIANRLRKAGYVTGWVGKWHLGNDDNQRPSRRGFDETYGFLAGGHSYFPVKTPPIFRNDEPVESPPYLTDAFGQEAVAFIDRHQHDPFFLYLAFNAVHTPMQATDERLEKFANIADPARRTYAAMMLAMDEAIGGVLKKLADAGLEENTLVLFISDNGGPTMKGTAINHSDNTPLRGSKRTTLEGGIRVPFMVKWPGKVPAGKVYDKPVITLDFLPTAMKAAGVEVAKDWHADGVDLLPYLTGKNGTAPHETLYWRFGPQMAIRKGEWKLVCYDPVVDGEKGKATDARLYNLAEDIGESHDLIKDHPDKAAELQAAWDQWNEQNVEPLWPHVLGKKKATKAAKAASKGKAKRSAEAAAAG
jgi:arylsulfatase A-like enzyme